MYEPLIDLAVMLLVLKIPRVILQFHGSSVSLIKPLYDLESNGLTENS